MNLVYEPFSAADAKLFNASKLPAGPEPQLTLRHGDEAGRDAPEPAPRAPQPPDRPARAPGFLRLQLHARRQRGRAAPPRPPASTPPHSVLRTGDWYKMGVAESGIYKLDKATLRNMGLNRTV